MSALAGCTPKSTAATRVVAATVAAAGGRKRRVAGNICPMYECARTTGPAPRDERGARALPRETSSSRPRHQRKRGAAPARLGEVRHDQGGAVDSATRRSAAATLGSSRGSTNIEASGQTTSSALGG